MDFHALFEIIFCDDAFLQTAPVERILFLDEQDTPDKTWRSLREWAQKVRGRIAEHKQFKLKAWTVRDKGSAFVEWLPCPLPNADVLTEGGIVRYAATLFFNGKTALISLKRLNASDTVPVSGINLDAGAALLTNEIRRLCLPMISRETVVIDRRHIVKTALKANADNTYPVSPQVAADAIKSLPEIGIFLLVHAVEAAICTFLPDDTRGLYSPAVMLSETVQTASLQVNVLRQLLAEWTFGRGLNAPVGLVPEITLQTQGDLELLQTVSSVPVLAHVDLDALQKKLTTLMQSAQTDLAVSGRSRHPFRTVPLLVGSELPADNVTLRLNWSAYEKIDSKTIAVVKNAMADILHKPSRLARTVTAAVYTMPLGDRTYPAAHFLTVSDVLDAELFVGTPFRGTLNQRAESIVGSIWAAEDAQEKRFAAAVDMLTNRATTDALVAPSVNEMTDKHLGFFYRTQDGQRWAAFELNECFPALMARVGLDAKESKAFREYAKRRGFLVKLSEKIRGREKTPGSHVLFCAEKLGYEAR